MAQAARPTEEDPQPGHAAAAPTHPGATRTSNRMVFALAAACAAIPMALLVTGAAVGGSALGDVSLWAWVLLVIAMAAAMAMAARTLLR